MTVDPNNWKEWKNYVLQKLDSLEKCYGNIDEKVNKIAIDIAGLKVKSGIWGLIGGAIPVVIGLAIWFLRSKNG